MSVMRSMLFGAAALAGVALTTSLPAQADTSFYIGPNGARVYYNDYDRDYRYRDYDRRIAYRSCHNEVSYEWRFGERVRVVERVCYNRWGNRYVADRDYYPIRTYRRHYYDW